MSEYEGPRRSGRLAALAVGTTEESSERTSHAGASSTTIGKFELVSVLKPARRSRKPPVAVAKVPSPPLPTVEPIQWESRGYNSTLQTKFATLESNLNRFIKELLEASPCCMDTGLSILVTYLNRALSTRDFGYYLPHNSLLNPLWKAFADSLKRCDGNRYIAFHLCFALIELKSSVLDILAPSLAETRLTSLCFMGNNLQGGAILIISDIISNVPTLEALVICRNDVGSQKEHVVARLSDAIRCHPNLRRLALISCQIGNNKSLLECVRNKALRDIDLGSNAISAEGAYFMAKHVANSDSKGRLLTKVSLEGNKLSDKDAALFASALRVNKTLVRLNLKRNNISDEGRRVLLKAVYDYFSLNAISDSNNTCHVEVEDGNSVSPAVASINNSSIPEYFGRKSKLVTKIFSSAVPLSTLSYEDVPVELVPEVLELLQCNSGDRCRVPRTLIFDLLRAMPVIFVASNRSRIVIERRKRTRDEVTPLGERSNNLTMATALKRRALRKK